MVDGRFEEEYKKICETDPKEASLFALSTLAMRHINSSSLDHFNIINEILNSKEFESQEIKKVKSIINNVIEYDAKLIKHLVDIEHDICECLFNSETNICQTQEPKKQDLKVERQKQNIKKWWE